MSILKNMFKQKLGMVKELDILPTVQPGMKLTIDPTLFIIGGESLKTPMPPAESVVNSLRTATTDNINWYRIYTPQGFIQINLQDNGVIEECRYFTNLDSVYPGNTDEWDFWLGENTGYIGLNSFQTKDGTLWTRLYGNESQHRILPLEIKETVLRDLEKTPKSIIYDSMVYWKSTGVKTPEFEYLMVNHENVNDSHSIQLYTGVDINPESFNVL